MCDAVSLRSRSLSPFTINISCAHTWSKLRFFSGHKFPSPCPARRAPPPRTHFFSCTAVALSHHRVPSLFKEVSSLLVCQTCLSHTNAKEARANAKEEEGRERETEEQYNNNSERQQWVWPRTFLFICVVVVYPVCVYKLSCVGEAHGHAQRKGGGGVRHTTPTRSRDRCREFSACAANESVVTHAYPLPTRQ